MLEHSQPQRLEVRIARNDRELEQIYRLRYEVFVEEAKNLQMRNASRLETDAYDSCCDHLLVLDADTGKIAGTYRLMTGKRAMAGIGFYSETEFDLTGFAEHKPTALELGRSCVAPEYRGGRAIQMLWEGIARYAEEHGCQTLIGCASVHFHSKDELHDIYSLLRHKRIITDRFGIRPLETHRIPDLQVKPLPEQEKELFRKLPPLMKGYQWLGAEIGGDPAYDPVFESVDFFIVLEKEKMTRRYRRHFMNG